MNTNTNIRVDKDGMETSNISQKYQSAQARRMAPISFDLAAISKNPTDWVAFSPPQWPEPSYDESPLSSNSGEYYSPVNDDATWNPFEQSFANSRADAPVNGSTEPYPNFPPSTYVFNGGSPDPMMSAFPYVNLSAINEDQGHLSDDIEDTPQPIARIPSPFPSPTIRQPAWGTSRPARRGSASSAAKPRHHKRTKSNSSENSNSSNSPSSSHKLRSTSNASASSYGPATTPGARTNHNLVEKQYRTRLNGQFETLLQTLPRNVITDAGEKRVSKAEVLVLAKEHIRELEREKRALEEENLGLEGCVESLRRRWVEMGGVVMP